MPTETLTPTTIDHADVQIAALSRWVDDAPANRSRDPEAALWGRVSKVAEESGEVIAALIGATGQNPRKGVTATMDDVGKELLDVALTALAAYEHINGNGGGSLAALVGHIEKTAVRAGLVDAEAAS
jgi:hypothetical protein